MADPTLYLEQFAELVNRFAAPLNQRANSHFLEIAAQFVALLGLNLVVLKDIKVCIVARPGRQP